MNGYLADNLCLSGKFSWKFQTFQVHLLVILRLLQVKQYLFLQLIAEKAT